MFKKNTQIKNLNQKDDTILVTLNKEQFKKTNPLPDLPTEDAIKKALKEVEIAMLANIKAAEQEVEAKKNKEKTRYALNQAKGILRRIEESCMEL